MPRSACCARPRRKSWRPPRRCRPRARRRLRNRRLDFGNSRLNVIRHRTTGWRTMTLVVLIVLALASLGGAGSLPAQVPAGGPPDSLIPDGVAGASIRRGRAILEATRDSLPSHVGNALSCTNCHLDAGRRENGSWVGVHARYPQYRPRSNIVETIEYRVNDCLKRSMNGSPLDRDDTAMRDMIAYFAFLSRGVPVGPAPRPAPGPWATMKRD